jgi:uncharacterized RDD family membrane protein YckC
MTREVNSQSAASRLLSTAGRLFFKPVRAVAGPRGIDVPRHLENVTVDALATPTAARTVDSLLAGPLPDAITRSLIEHRVVERVVAEAIASGAVERAVVSAVQDERTEQLLERVLASPDLERLLAEALESKVTLDLTDRLLESPEFERMLEHVLTSPQVRAALAQQSTSLAAETVAGARRRGVRLDEAAERGPRRWSRRGARTGVVPFAGIATRGFGLAVDALLVTLVFVIGAALVGLIASLVGHLRPAWLVGVIEAASWLTLVSVYFVGFWTAAGQTPGMRLMRLRVVTGSDAPPGFVRSVVRLFGLALAIIPCFAGFLPVLFDGRRRALQDYLAGTVVFYEERAPLDALGFPREMAEVGRNPSVTEGGA